LLEQLVQVVLLELADYQRTRPLPVNPVVPAATVVLVVQQ
jgi:hypothetical protein